MRMHFHGGLCCGIKHLTGFYYPPSSVAYNVTHDDDAGFHYGEDFDGDCSSCDCDDCDDEDCQKQRQERRHWAESGFKEGYRPDIDGNEVNSGWSFFVGTLPVQTYEERLDSLIRYTKAMQEHGAIEVVLTSGQAPFWGDVLEKKGFKQYMPTFKNSNSGADLHTYHLIY